MHALGGGVEVLKAGGGGDDEARGHRESDVGHLCVCDKGRSAAGLVCMRVFVRTTYSKPRALITTKQPNSLRTDWRPCRPGWPCPPCGPRGTGRCASWCWPSWAAAARRCLLAVTRVDDDPVSRTNSARKGSVIRTQSTRIRTLRDTAGLHGGAGHGQRPTL